MKMLKLEFYKCRRRKIVLMCAAVLAVELIWMEAFFTRQDTEDLKWSWILLLYNLAMVCLLYTSTWIRMARRSSSLPLAITRPYFSWPQPPVTA